MLNLESGSVPPKDRREREQAVRLRRDDVERLKLMARVNSFAGAKDCTLKDVAHAAIEAYWKANGQTINTIVKEASRAVDKLSGRRRKADDSEDTPEPAEPPSEE